jgi:hypothetical protein
LTRPGGQYIYGLSYWILPLPVSLVVSCSQC